MILAPTGWFQEQKFRSYLTTAPISWHATYNPLQGITNQPRSALDASKLETYLGFPSGTKTDDIQFFEQPSAEDDLTIFRNVQGAKTDFTIDRVQLDVVISSVPRVTNDVTVRIVSTPDLMPTISCSVDRNGRSS